jgi:hypothetical protein
LVFGSGSGSEPAGVVAVRPLHVVRERWDDECGLWVLIECSAFNGFDAFRVFERVLVIVSAWDIGAAHRVQVRSVGIDGHVDVVRSVVVESVGGAR